MAEAYGTGHSGTVLYRLCCKGLSILMYRPGQLPVSSSVISGELQAGGNGIRLFDWSALMTLQNPPWTACKNFRVSYRRLAPKFQHSLSAVTLGIILYGFI